MSNENLLLYLILWVIDPFCALALLLPPGRLYNILRSHTWFFDIEIIVKEREE